MSRTPTATCDTAWIVMTRTLSPYGSGAVVLHGAGAGLPALAVPAVHVAAIRARAVAGPRGPDRSAAADERGEASLDQACLTPRAGRVERRAVPDDAGSSVDELR